MSYNQPYRNPQGDKDARIYTRDSSAYRSGVRSASPHRASSSSSELPVFPPNKALSFLHSCGLDAEDLQTLAKLPEHLITTDTLPDLLTEIKKKKLSHTSSPRSSALPVASSARSWDDRSHAQSVEYPLDLPVHQSYSLNREQSQTWDDHWGDVQQTSSPAASSYVVEYNHLKEKKSYYDELSYATEPSREMSYSNYGKDVGHSSHFSSRDASHSSHLSSRDSQSSHLSSRDSQSSHRSSRDLGQPSQLSSRYISQSSVRSSRDVAQSSHLSSRDVGVHSHIAQPSPVSNRNVGIPSLLSMRDLAPASRLSSRAVRQPSWKKGSAPRVPTRKEASDFHGRIPPVFPYACVLCEITVLSNKDWSVHINGPQHANSQLSLVEKYPAWDQTIHSARRNEPELERPKHGTIQERDRISSHKIGPSGSRSGALTSRSAPASRKKLNKNEAPSKCKVVCIKFENDGVDEAYLKHLLGQFGAIVKIIMFPNLALAEMGTTGQAEDIVKYFSQNPLRFKGKKLEFSLSAAFSFLQGSRVVSFSPLPSGEGVSSELTAIAKLFGSVIHSQFLPHRGYVEMALVEEASKLVDHYSTNSLKLKGKTITVAFSTEYQTLSDMESDKDKLPAHHSSNRRRARRSYSPRSRSSRKDSPSPKRRASEEGSNPSQGHDSRKREESRLSRQDSSSKSHFKNGSPSKEQEVKTEEEEGEGEMVGEDNQSDNMDEGSDLEGLAVIADDGEELNTEDEYTVDEDLDDEAFDTSDALIDAPEDMQIMSESNQTIPLDINTSDIQPETAEGDEPTATTSERSNEEGNEEAQEPQQGEEKELQEEKEGSLEEQKGEQKEELKQGEQIEELKQDEQKEEFQQGDKKQELQEEEHKEIQDKEKEQNDETMTVEEEAADSSENLENTLTEQGDEIKISASGIEEQYGRVLEVAGFPVAKKYSEADLLKIGEKYGDVAGCCLVRSNRKVEKALIEMVNAADAAKLEADCKKQHIKLGGKILRIKVSEKYNQVNEGKEVDHAPGKVECDDLMNIEDITLNFEDKNTEPTCSVAPIEETTVLMSETETTEEAETPLETNMDSFMQTSSDEEEVYGRVIRVRNLPMSDEYTDADFLKIAEPYGTVKRHWMFRLHRTGLIEMENASEAEKVVSAANMNKITVAGKHPKIAVSTKHAHLNKRYFLYQSELEKTKDESSTQNDEQVPEADNGTGTQAETQTLLMDPVGMEFVRPVVGYFCNLCNVIYASEEEAKGEHCRTPLHHQKLKEHNEQNGSK
ncbi:matrin 3-like 1.1 isoform X2 [Danio aesculapii]|uniref:matrin 3-like 1.1 isoform X2 n=1 Tax=Danio aesculapii TaxID=1142201 RepID=UPI0024BFA58C|nr:matrin 3-like 1.1 isoform X2 [Danio aesculapii]